MIYVFVCLLFDRILADCGYELATPLKFGRDIPRHTVTFPRHTARKAEKSELPSYGDDPGADCNSKVPSFDSSG